MSKSRSPITNILTIVAFLVLVVIATTVYGGNEQQKAELENNFFWNQTKNILDTVWAATQGLAFMNLERNTGLNQEVQSTWDTVSDSTAAPANEETIWSKLVANIKKEWNNGGAVIDNSSAVDSIQTEQLNVSTDTGAGQWLANLWTKKSELSSSTNYFDFLKNLINRFRPSFIK